MRIIVLLRPPHKDPFSEEVLHGLSPGDRAALHTALHLADSCSSVVALTVGPPADEVGLGLALQAGAHRAIRIWAPSIDSQDPLSISSALAAGIKQLGFDVVLAGHRSSDWGTGITGPAVAHFLGVPHVTSVTRVQREESSLLLEHLREDEIISLALKLPALITLSAAPAGAADPPQTIPAIEKWNLETLRSCAQGNSTQRLDVPLKKKLRKVAFEVNALRENSTPPSRDLSALLLQLRNSGLLR